MDVVGGSFLESPVTMSHEQLPSPLTYDGPFTVAGGLEEAAITGAMPRRRSSKGHQGGVVKRSASSPNVRSLSTSSESALSLSEKRRNKLGYHRTSVACVHCRRRKIRCLLAPDDPQNRCSNCIRLKKECNFYPVDQQPESERRPRTGSKNEGKSGPGSVSSSSSPNVAGSRPSDQSDAFAQLSHLPHSAYSTGMMSIASSNMSPPGSAGWDMRFFEGQHIPSSHPSSGGDEHTQNPFWKVPDTPVTPATFSPYTTASASGMHYQHPTWPMRSMSYDEHTHQQQRHDSHGNIPYVGSIDHLRRSTINMPPPDAPPLAGHPATLASTSAATMAGDISGHHVMSTNTLVYPGVPQAWNMLPTQSPKSEFGGAPWYPDPNALAKVSEDEVSHFGSTLQGGMYANR